MDNPPVWYMMDAHQHKWLVAWERDGWVIAEKSCRCLIYEDFPHICLFLTIHVMTWLHFPSFRSNRIQMWPPSSGIFKGEKMDLMLCYNARASHMVQKSTNMDFFLLCKLTIWFVVALLSTKAERMTKPAPDLTECCNRWPMSQGWTIPIEHLWTLASAFIYTSLLASCCFLWFFILEEMFVEICQWERVRTMSNYFFRCLVKIWKIMRRVVTMCARGQLD